MSVKQTFTVLKPVRLEGIGTKEPGDTVTLHPRQAVFLVTAGVVERETMDKPSLTAKRTRKGAAK